VQKAPPKKLRSNARRLEALGLRLQGKTYAAIGDAMGITDVAAWKLVMRALDDQEKQLSEDVEKVRALEIHKLIRIEDEAWKAWERGIGKKQKTITERNQGGKGAVAKARIETEELNGDPRYLAVILDCQQRRARLLGLDAPAKIEGSGPGGGPLIEVVIRDAVAKQSPIEEKAHVETDGRAEEPTPSE
jgi:hypothetical protein